MFTIYVLQSNGVDVNWQTSLAIYIAVAFGSVATVLRHLVPHRGPWARGLTAALVFILAAWVGAIGTTKEYRHEHPPRLAPPAVVPAPPKPTVLTPPPTQHTKAQGRLPTLESNVKSLSVIWAPGPDPNLIGAKVSYEVGPGSIYHVHKWAYGYITRIHRLFPFINERLYRAFQEYISRDTQTSESPEIYPGSGDAITPQMVTMITPSSTAPFVFFVFVHISWTQTDGSKRDISQCYVAGPAPLFSSTTPWATCELVAPSPLARSYETKSTKELLELLERSSEGLDDDYASFRRGDGNGVIDAGGGVTGPPLIMRSWSEQERKAICPTVTALASELLYRMNYDAEANMSGVKDRPPNAWIILSACMDRPLGWLFPDKLARSMRDFGAEVSDATRIGPEHAFMQFQPE